MSSEHSHNGTDLTGLSYNNVKVYGQMTAPTAITVNDVALEAATGWLYDDTTLALQINIQTQLADPLTITIE